MEALALLGSDALDNIIGVAVVILLLSLIVQAIQAFIKKILRVKSRHLEASLLDLFNRSYHTETTAPSFKRIPVIGRATAALQSPAEQLYKEVMNEFRRLGRVTARGTWMLDSLSKGDLTLVLSNTELGRQATADITTAASQLRDLITRAKDSLGDPRILDEVDAFLTQATTTNARSEANSLDELTEHLQLLHDQAAMADQPDTNKIRIVEDLMRSTQAVADATNTTQARAALRTIETWFDTTMLGFSERYERSMRTYSLLIAAVLVFLLNANVFAIYRNVAKSALLKQQLAEVGGRLLKETDSIAQAQDTLDEKKTQPATTTSNASPPASNDEPLDRDFNPGNQQPDVTQDDLTGQIAHSKHEIDRLIGLYAGFGFAPFTGSDVAQWWDGLRYRDTVGGRTWAGRRIDDAKTLIGWALMVVLLSIGAPFWHDTLESLYGVKNLLRKRSEERNIETRQGAGNPKA